MAIDQGSLQYGQGGAVTSQETRNRVLRNTYWLLALSMIPTVLGAWIGANGLGVPVVRALNSVNTALGFESGFIIVVVAILLDRMLRVSK